MYTSTYPDASNLLGRAETDFYNKQKPTGTDSKMGEDAFLKLLVTQLSHQDPTDPMDDKELTSQLAQFSSLEQLSNINEGIKDLSKKMQENSLLNGLGFLGNKVTAKGDEVTKKGDDISSVFYKLEGDANRVYVNVFDKEGKIINTVELGSKKAGEYTFTWDGRDFYGRKVPDGTYKLSFGAEGTDGKSVLIDTEVSGKVVGITTKDGSTYLKLEDGREVPLSMIDEVTTL